MARRFPLLILVVVTYLGVQAENARARHDASRSTAAVSIPLTRSTWIWSSMPVGEDPSMHTLVEWYNARGVKERDLNPDLRAYEGADNERQVLELNIKAPYAQTAIDPAHWTGITQPLSTVGDTPRFVEIWVNDFTPNHATTQGILKINLGRVSEDAFWDPRNLPNGRLDTEDKNVDGRLDGGPQEIAEDTGLDGLFDVQEPGYDPVLNPDPNGDDYAYTFNSDDYSHINNFERNGLDDPNSRPDTEDLNRNGILDADNAYFEESIDLSDPRYVAIDVPQLYAGDPDVEPDNGWRLFRIPVTDSTFARVGFASWDNVQAIRIWFEGLSERRRLQIGGISLRGDTEPNAAPSVVLYQNYPNPFNHTTLIPYYLPRDGPVRIAIYDVNGRPVFRMTHAMQFAGVHEAVWTGRDMSGRPAASGVYFYRLEAGGTRLTRRMVLAK